MAIVKRFNKLLGLEKIDVLVDEKDTSRHIVITDMPESLPQGKSSFLIEVSPYMRKGIELQIDFIDSKGKSIYTEPVSNYLEGTSRTVSVEVYNTTSPGVATMIIVGELDRLPLNAGNYSETTEVPEDFRGVYNVRLTREVIINSAEVNIQPIRFYSSPRLTATEKRYGTLVREEGVTEVTSSAFTVTGTPGQQEPYDIWVQPFQEFQSQGVGNFDIQEVEAPDGDVKGDEAAQEQLKRHSKKRTVRLDSKFKRSRRIRRRNSPPPFPYKFTIEDDNHEFTPDEIGAEIRFSNIDTSIYVDEDLEQNDITPPVSFNVLTNADNDNYPSHYTASIASILNNKIAQVNTPFTKEVDWGSSHRILEMKATGSVHYTPQPTASYSTTNISSYADITLSHLRTFSGEVFKAKVYVRAEGSFDDYKLLAEVPVESPELMVNNDSVGIGERTGYFVPDDFPTSSSYLYWDLFGSTNGLTAASSTSTASFDNSTMLDSVMVSGSTSTFTDQIRFQLKDAYKFNLTKNIDYDLSFNAIGQKDTDGRALMIIYVSGSSMKQSSNLHYDELAGTEVAEPSQYGRRMGALEVASGEDSKKSFGLVRHNFNSNVTGDAKLQFRIIAGQWNISDISIVPATDTGFSPSFVNFQQELPSDLVHKRPETLEFLTEFYDINNNIADEIAFSTGSVFTGANIVITGADNIIPGDIFLGGFTTASGIHFGGIDSTLPETGEDGATGSGFIRSIGYQGFISASAQSGSYGFMIYSGSVLPNSGDSYNGVGLELVGASGSLKFRTSPSVFDVQADSFFVGKTTTQYISGSGQKVEISSSNFHLSSSGDVNMSGTITSTAGNIGGFTINDGSLTSGTGNGAVTMSSAAKIIAIGSGSTFNKGDLQGGFRVGIDTDGDFKFAVGSAASYIHADSTGVSIKSDSFVVTASVAEIDVDVYKLSANNLFISSSGGGFISAGNPRPTGITGTNKGFYVRGDTGVFLAGNAAGGHISFDGTNTSLSSSAFYLGSPTQYVSGSNGNIEISSSNFHLEANGNVTMSGNIRAAGGDIAGWTIGSGYISKALSGSAAHQDYTRVYLSSANDNDKNIGEGLHIYRKDEDIENGEVKVVRVGGLSDTTNLHANNDYGIQVIQKDSNNNYSNILYIGEATQSISGLDIGTGAITSPGGGLILSGSGQITGSTVLFTGGNIGGWNLSTTGLTDSTGAVQFSSTEASMSLGTGQEALIRGNSNSPFISLQPSVALASKAYGETGVFLGVAGGSTPLFSAVGSGGHIKFNGTAVDITATTVHMSGSSITLETPKFFFGKKSTQFISGSNGNIEISSSDFHLTRQGDVTASAILLGNKAGGNYLQFVGSTLSVRGDITADSIAVPSAAPTPSSSITTAGLLTTVSASIGGFDITSAEIKDKDGNLRLKSNGQITGSKALLTAGKIAAWNISGNNLNSTGGGIRLNANGNNAEISINSHTFANEGIQLGYNSGNPRFFAGVAGNFIKYTTSDGVNIKTLKATISGSAVTIETPKFFLGKKSNQYVSGSNGNIEISSSNFHLTSQGNVTMSGEITAAGGTIGGFTIGDELTSTAGTLILRGASGVITASNAKITGDITANTITANTAGTIANFTISSTEIASSNNKLRLKSNGQITASAVSMSGTVTATAGNIAGFQISGTQLKQGTSFYLDGNSSGTYFVSSSNFQVTPSGQLTGSSALFDGTLNVTGTGTIAGWTIASDRFNSSDDNFRIDSAGKLTIKNHSFGQSGFQILENSGTTQFYVGNGTTKFIKFDGSNVDIGTERLTASGSSINLGAPSFRLGSATNFISGSGGTLVIQNSGTTTLSGSAVTIETPKFFLGKKSSQYVSGSGGNIEISSSKFHLQADGDVIMNDITASNANVSGKMTATSGEIGGFTIGDDLSNSAGSTLKLKGASGQITASAAKITGDITANTITANTAGTIANFQINSTEIKSANENLRLKANGQITASAAQITGKITATSGQIAGFTISGNTLTATNFTLDASGKSITLGTGTDIFIADGDTGIQLGHGTFSSAPFSVTKAGLVKATSGTIGGWTLSSTQISSNNLILNSAGIIQTSDYASNEKGWRLSPANGGEAEFQNVKIRGTLSTAVFEKETVNAVGGQLYIANSTALTGSATVAATAATMSVVNVGGFAANEILSAKKVDATSFATEYMLVQSSSRDFPSSEKDFRGKLYVVRGYRSGSLGASGSLGDAANISQSYEPGQVIVSTGKIGTGFIRLNANPNDVTTPYIDIVERTGSGVYDVDLKARLGDLSGLSSGLLYGNASPGFGLFTENVFLQGAITATTGSFTGKVHVGQTDGIVIDGNAKKLHQGTGTWGNSNTGFYFDSEGSASLGTALKWDGSTLTVTGTVNISGGTGFATAASVSGSFPSATSVSASLNASSSALQTNINTVESNVSGAFTGPSASIATKIMTDASGKIVQTPSTSGLTGLILKSSHLGFADSGTFKAYIGSTGNFLFKNDNDNLISFGASTAVGDGTTTSNLVIKAANTYLSGSSVNLLTSRFYFGNSANYISGSEGNIKIFSTGDTTLSGSSVNIQTPKFFLGKRGAQYVSGSNNLIEISSSKFHLQNDGDVIMNQITASNAKVSGDITADTITANTAGTIGGFSINSVGIKSSNSKLVMSASGQLTASSYRFEGNGVITGSVTIGTSATILGSLSAGSIATPSSGPPYKSEINAQGYAKFISASIGGFDIDSTTISDLNNRLVMHSTGQITGSKVLFTGGTITGSGMDILTPKFYFGQSSNYISGSNGNISIVNTGTTTLSGSSVDIKTPKFYFGQSSNYISGSGGNISIVNTGTTTLSGSAVNIQTPKFYLGQGSSQFISGSNGNIEISSSAFHLDTANNTMTVSGSITATTGKIGGMLLEANKLKSQYGDGSTVTHTVTYSGGDFYIDGVQQPTLELKVGNTYKFDNSHASNGGHPFRFATSADGTIYSTGVTVVGSEGSGGTAYAQIVVTSDTPSTLYYKCTAHSGEGGQLNIVTIGTLELNGVNGQITGSDVLISGGKISGSNLSIDVPNVTMSGSSVDIRTPKFFLGSTGQFISGSNNNIEITSSMFHLDPKNNKVSISGSITATDGKIGGWNMSGYILQSIDSNGGVKFDSYNKQIGIRSGSHVDTTILEFGRIGGSVGSPQFGIEMLDHTDSSKTLFKFGEAGNELAGWTISDTQISSSGMLMDSSAKKLVIHKSTFGQDGIQLEYNSGNPRMYVGDGSNEFLKFDGSSLSIQTQDAHISGSSITLETPKFFLGKKGSQFVSGSNGNLEISSSAYHLSASSFKLGDKLTWDGSTLSVTGAINITSGTGFATAASVSSSFSSATSVSASINASSSALTTDINQVATSVSASLNASSSALQTNINTNASNLTSVSSSITSRIMTDISGSLIDVSPAPSGKGLYLNYPYMGYYSNSAWDAYISASGAFLFKADANNLVSFGASTSGGDGVSTTNFVLKAQNAYMSGSKVNILTERFFFGSGNQYLSGSNGNLKIFSTGNTTLSGSSVTLATPKFFFGNPTNYISGSEGNISIVNTGTTTLSGSAVTIETPKFFLGKKGSQFVSGSNGNLEISSSTFHVSGGSTVMSGKVTATSGEVGGFTIDTDEIKSTNVLIDSANEKITLGSANAIKLQGGGTDNFIAMGSKSTFSNEGTGTAGILIGMDATNPQAEFVKDANNYFIFDDGVDIKTDTLKASGSNIILETPRFYLGSDSQYVSGSGTNIEISSSNFHLTPQGQITASAGLIGGWSMTTSSFNTGVTGATMELGAGNNRITLYDAAKSHMAGDALIQIGELQSSANLPFGSNAYGIVLSGSNSNMGNNEVRIIAEQGDYGTPSDNFQYTSSVIQGKAVSRGGSIGGGRAGIYGESAFELGSTVPFGYSGTMSSQKGIMAGLVGSHRNFNNGFYRKTAGVMGVNNISKLNQTDFGSVIRTGSFGVVSVGPMYVTASTADHEESGIGYSILAGGGYVHVSASSAGDFGGKEYGVLIDSSNVLDQESALTFKTRTTGPNDYEYSMGLDGDGTFHLSKGTALGTNDILSNHVSNIALSIYGGYGSTGATIYSSGNIATNGYITVDDGLGVGTAGTATAGLIRATNDVIAYYSSDKRLKNNLIKIGNPLDKISQLNGYEFDWIAKEGIHENEGHDVGVIAQEVEKVIPEIVQTRDSGYKAVKYEKIVPLLIEGIKEQQEQIDELKKEVEELKNASSR